MSAKDNNLINSDGDNGQQIKHVMSSPIAYNDHGHNRVLENQPQKTDNKSNSDIIKPQRSVLFSSVVSDIENKEDIQLIDRSNNSSNDNNSKNISKIRSSSANSSSSETSQISNNHSVSDVSSNRDCLEPKVIILIKS